MRWRENNLWEQSPFIHGESCSLQYMQDIDGLRIISVGSSPFCAEFMRRFVNIAQLSPRWLLCAFEAPLIDGRVFFHGEWILLIE